MLIYGLIDPRTNSLRYIGQTTQPLKVRFAHHIKPCEVKKITHKCQWIKGLLKEGLKPEIFVIEEVAAYEDLNEAEIFYMDYFRFLGFDLVNGTPGGRGAALGNKNSLGHKHSAETKAKMALASTGRQNNLGKVWSSETNRKKALNNPRRKVIMDDLGNVYESIAEASIKLEIPTCGIRRILNGKAKRYKGRSFVLVNNKEN